MVLQLNSDISKNSWAGSVAVAGVMYESSLSMFCLSWIFTADTWATKQIVLKKKINNELQGVNSLNSFCIILFCRLTVPALSDKLSNC